ncbi:LysR substrate-binding domain-containing protein [Gluconacetobacter tumulisoli]|uniref:LysR family transcriptional regulator n=1 Tax=Gluconacetobacter tumulisoli TaxID=1286189 RepID=A0A7W4K8P7_9PROT|nr:LysR substrate-binding domain-containing protein [Gluconacetobacter tumulisoli]MBB2202350.1 LysR family transcriptional regulator [Gluconacetobacter tumulisoli]
MSFKQNVPSISALVTFEAAMRLRSFTAAARELGVSQAAVSRQVRLLEEDFGVPLFQRAHRAVIPTAAGMMLGGTLGEAFHQIRDVVESIRRPRESDTLTVGATLAQTQFWLLPRLPQFRALHPDLKIRVVSQDEMFDARDDLDVMIRFGVPPVAGGRTLASARDSVFPVCSPAFLAGIGGAATADALPHLPLIGSDAPDPSWIQWPDWFDAVGLGPATPRAVLQFNHYTDGIAAAIAGQGVALGWRLLLQEQLRAGLLVRVTDLVLQPQASYNILIPDRRAPCAAAHLFAEWLAGQFPPSDF